MERRQKTVIWENVQTLIQCIIAYVFLCLLLPSICLKPYVKGRSLSYRFLFYQVCGNMYLILWGFVLSYLHLFFATVLWIALVILPPVLRIFSDCLISRHSTGKWELPGWMIRSVRKISDVLTGVYGWRKFFSDLRSWIGHEIKRVMNKYLNGHSFELLAICIVLLFVILYYGNFKLTKYGYASSDDATHFFWTDNLAHNKPFTDGLYPFGLHFLMAVISTMFGLTVHRTVQVFSILTCSLVFLFLYFYLRSVFRSKVAVYFGWIVYVVSNFLSYSTYHRFFMTIPMEFALAALFATLYALTDYLYSRRKNSFWMFVLALSWSFHIHMYVTIFLAFLLVAFGFVHLFFVIRQKIFWKMILGGFLAVFFSLAPFVVGYAAGYKLQSSFDWAFGLMGIDLHQESQPASVPSPDAEESPKEVSNGKNIYFAINEIDVSRLLDLKRYNLVTDDRKTEILLILEFVLILYALFALPWKKTRRLGRSILFLALSWALSHFICIMPDLGLPQVISEARIIVFWAIMCVPLFVVPCEICFLAVATVTRSGRFANFLIGVGVLCTVVWGVQNGWLKSAQGASAFITESDYRTSLSLVENATPRTWTVVSQTYGRMALVNYGYHYEVIDLISTVDKDEEGFYIPTKDIYIVVENLIDQYAADTYVAGRYSELKSRRDLYDDSTFENMCPPSRDLALTSLEEGEISKNLHNFRIYYYPFRAVIASKLYYWMEKMKEVYPNHISVYDQDEVSTVYHIWQDPYFPLNLVVDYMDDLGVE